MQPDPARARPYARWLAPECGRASIRESPWREPCSRRHGVDQLQRRTPPSGLLCSAIGTILALPFSNRSSRHSDS